MTTLAEQHKADQTRLVGLLAAEVAPKVTPLPNASAVKRLIDELVALITQYNRASAGIAADYFDAERAAVGVPGRLTVPIADSPVEDQLVHGLGWATRDLTEPSVDLDAVLTRVEGTSSRMALDGGRSTLVEAAHADPVCRGFVRVARPGSCGFCALLSTRVFDTSGRARGVYKTRETAQRRGRNQDQDKYHNDCRCSVQPIFQGQDYEPPPHVQEFARIYRDSNRAPGQSGLAAFRQALADERGAAAH